MLRTPTVPSFVSDKVRLLPVAAPDILSKLPDTDATTVVAVKSELPTTGVVTVADILGVIGSGSDLSLQALNTRLILNNREKSRESVLKFIFLNKFLIK